MPGCSSSARRSRCGVPLDAPAPGDVDTLLDSGAAGLCLPAAALAGPDELDRVGPLIERLAAGRCSSTPGAAAPGPAAPPWWPAMTSYVAGMHAAWLAWAQWGRPRHPDLKVVWAMLAGGAPLHAERLAARGGPARAVHDERAWSDVSSWAPTRSCRPASCAAGRSPTRKSCARSEPEGEEGPPAKGFHLGGGGGRKRENDERAHPHHRQRPRAL